MDSIEKYEEIIDMLQRKLKRRILDINWQDKVSGEKLYKETNPTPWNKIVKVRGLTWYSH